MSKCRFKVARCSPTLNWLELIQILLVVGHALKIKSAFYNKKNRQNLGRKKNIRIPRPEV